MDKKVEYFREGLHFYSCKLQVRIRFAFILLGHEGTFSYVLFANVKYNKLSWWQSSLEFDCHLSSWWSGSFQRQGPTWKSLFLFCVLVLLCLISSCGNLAEDESGNSRKVPCILHMDSIRGSHKGLKNLIQR